MAVPVEVTGRDAHVPRRLRLDLSCEIMSGPAKIVLGHPTLKNSGLLKAAAQDLGGLPDTPEDWIVASMNGAMKCPVGRCGQKCEAALNSSEESRCWTYTSG